MSALMSEYEEAKAKIVAQWGSLNKAMIALKAGNLDATLRCGATISPSLQSQLRRIGVSVRLVPRGSAWRGSKALQVPGSRKNGGPIPEEVLLRGAHCFAFVHGREDLWVLYPVRSARTGKHLLRRVDDGELLWSDGPLYFAQG